MNAVKSLTIVALLLGGTSLAMAQNGPATGGQPPAPPATSGPPPPGVIPHDAPRPQATAPSPYMQSAASPTGTAPTTRTATRHHKHIYMSAKSSHHRKGSLKNGGY
jgi:hypothetical protein